MKVETTTKTFSSEDDQFSVVMDDEDNNKTFTVEELFSVDKKEFFNYVDFLNEVMGYLKKAE